ncbi:MAG: CBS domain-containing protein [Pseudomonadota bacterium]
MPTSFQAPRKRETESRRSYSQSVETNLANEPSTVRSVLDRKGRQVHSIRPEATLAVAVRILRDKGIGALLVIDENDRVQGILSERDIVRKLAETPGQTLPQSVAENMTRVLEMCGPDDELVSVLRRMSEGRFRHMPVIEDGDLCGVVTIGDVVNFRLSQLEHEALQMKQMIVG